jgi:hypothetical protein
VLVLNGERDPFGIPGPQHADRVVVVPGEAHALKGHRAVIVAAVTGWLPAVLWPAADRDVKKEETKTKMGQSSSVPAGEPARRR